MMVGAVPWVGMALCLVAAAVVVVVLFLWLECSKYSECTEGYAVQCGAVLASFARLAGNGLSGW
jgi:hypothetical protein